MTNNEAQTTISARRFWVGVLSSLLLLCAIARAERLPVKNLTVEDGLPGNTIYRIVPDSHGFFWICTGSGLARYDGYSFRSFTSAHGLPAERVLDFLVTPSGEYWIATSGGLVRFNPEGTIYDRVITLEEAKTLDATPTFVTYVNPDAKHVSRLAIDDAGRLWVGTGNGLFRLEGDAFVKVELPFTGANANRHVYGLLAVSDGSVWVGAYDSLFRVTDTGVQSLSMPGVVFQTITRDTSGRTWVGTTNRGVIEAGVDESGNLAILRSFRELAKAGTWTNAITESFDGKMWLATDDGLIEFDRRTNQPVFEIYTRNSGVGHTKFSCIVEDRAGNLWLGTRASGIFRVVRRGVVSFGSEDNIEFVRAIFGCDKGSVCFVGFLSSTHLDGEGAKARLTGQDFYPYIWRLGRKTEDGFEWLRPNFARKVEYFGWGDRQNVFQSRTGEWWIGTGEGLYRFPPGQFADLSTSTPLDVFDASRGLAPVDVFRIYESANGDVWVASNGNQKEGLFRWNRESGELQNMTPEMRQAIPSKSGFVNSIREEGQGNIWFGFFDSGIARLRDGRFEYYDESNGFPRGGANDILLDAGGRLWVASGREGVARIDVSEKSPPVFTIYGSREGLSSNRTFALTADWRNMIYVGTDRDVNRIDPVSGKIIQVPFGDGIPQQQIRSAYTDMEGTLWFGTTSGMLKYVPSPDAIPESLDVLITKVTIEGAPHRVSALGVRQIDLGELAPEKNQIEVEFASLSAVTTDQPRYQYRLSPNAEWSDVQIGRVLTFAGLSAGGYTIEIRAMDSDGAVSQSPATAAFTILPPFYLRWWFLLISFALVGFGVYMLYRYRLQRLVELEKVRTRIATDLHDDIGANLTRISVLSEVAKQHRNNGDGELLESIAEIARESVASMSDIVWTIAPEHDSLVDLTRLMRRQAEEIFSIRDVYLKFNAPIKDMKLSVGARRDLLLIFKEAINNAAKHSGCTEVEIDLTLESSVLRMRIADNGQGFATGNRNPGHGLQSMKNRARQLGGNLTITSNGKTVVSLELNLRKSLVTRL